jgi:MFS family permease
MIVQTLITEFCFGMFAVVWQPYLLKIGTTLPQLGLIQGVITIFTALGSVLWGRISDIRGRKPVYIATILLRLAAVFFAFFSVNWYHFFGFAVFIGLSASWMQRNPNTSVLLAESVEKDRVGSAISLYTSLGTIIAIVAAPLGGVIAGESFKAIFLSCVLGELVSTILISTTLKETKHTHLIESRIAQVSGSLREMILPERVLAPLYVISILGTVSWSITFSNLNAILVDSYGLTPLHLGLMASVFSISWGLTQIPIGHLIDRSSKKFYLIVARVGYILVALGYLFYSSFPIFLFLQVFNGLAHSFEIPAFTSLVFELVPENRRATVMGKISTLPMIFGIPAPLIGGILYETFGFSTLLLIRIGLIISTILIIASSSLITKKT